MYLKLPFCSSAGSSLRRLTFLREAAGHLLGYGEESIRNIGKGLYDMMLLLLFFYPLTLYCSNTMKSVCKVTGLKRLLAEKGS